MKRFIATAIGLALTVGICLTAPGGQKADTPKEAAKKGGFKGTADLTDKVQIVTNFSQDGQAADVIFRNLDAGVGGLKGGPAVKTRTVTVELPINSPDKEARVRQIVRGFVSSTPKARAVLIIQSGGRTTVVDLAKAKVDDGTGPKGADKKRPNTEPGPKLEGGYDFQYNSEVTVPAGAKYQLTFIVHAERDVDDAEAGAYVVVDNLTVEIEKPGAKKR